MRGISTEFTDYRAYRQGDEVSKIDWKLLARRDRAYIRLSTEQTVLPTMVVLDVSASMAYPATTLEKWHFARHIAIGLASAAHNGRDPVGIAVASRQEGGHHLPPAPGAASCTRSSRSSPRWSREEHRAWPPFSSSWRIGTHERESPL